MIPINARQNHFYRMWIIQRTLENTKTNMHKKNHLDLRRYSVQYRTIDGFVTFQSIYSMICSTFTIFSLSE